MKNVLLSALAFGFISSGAMAAINPLTGKPKTATERRDDYIDAQLARLGYGSTVYHFPTFGAPYVTVGCSIGNTNPLCAKVTKVIKK